ncbi:MAG: sigma-54 dependent transcriptional regulator, partial [Pseudomonadota bacterium]
IYESDRMHELVTVATRIAPADVPVLITGANGAGKEKLAEILQANSSVKAGPFVKVNVGALPAELIESELFGAEEGAFTGAHQRRAGRFEAADGGTLFLDEIGNLSLAGQAKLLRVLQTGEFERLGSTQTRRVSVRVISATNADLVEAIAQGEFREDLFYRLNVIELQVPALAERMDDVLPLADHFLDGRAHLTPAARDAMLRHHWPGNVRELRNRLQRAQLLCRDGQVTPGDLDLAAEGDGRSSTHLGDTTVSLTATSVSETLERHGGNVSQAARELGMSRQALYRRMEKFGIPRQR